MTILFLTFELVLGDNSSPGKDLNWYDGPSIILLSKIIAVSFTLSVYNLPFLMT